MNERSLRPSIREVLARCREFGVRASYNRQTGEYRITPEGEEQAYYTDDRQDAIDTARAIDLARSKRQFGL